MAFNSSGHFLHSFTHVTVTEDCIEAEEYWEDTASLVAEENNIAKRLFSEDDDKRLSLGDDIAKRPSSEDDEMILSL